MIIFLINHSSKNINGNRVWRRCWREDRRAHGSISFSLLALNQGCRLITGPSPDIRKLSFQRKTWPLFSIQVFLVCSGGASCKSFLISLLPHAHPTTLPCKTHKTYNCQTYNCKTYSYWNIYQQRWPCRALRTYEAIPKSQGAWPLELRGLLKSPRPVHFILQLEKMREGRFQCAYHPHCSEPEDPITAAPFSRKVFPHWTANCSALSLAKKAGRERSSRL